METSIANHQFRNSTQFSINILPPTSPDSELIQKYKTELCRNWEKGTCHYGKNCLFAHGTQEIRRRAQPTNYKTKVCVNILRDGFCKYGNRCQFKHCEDITETAANSPLPKSSDSSRNSSAERRFPVFLDIERRCV